MRRWLAGGLISCAVLALGSRVQGAEGSSAADGQEAAARRLHARSIVVDTHVDAPYTLEKK